MGRQVNFYMLPEDEKQFIEFVRSTGDIAVYNWKNETPYPPEILEFPPPFSVPSSFDYCIFNKSLGSAVKTTFIEKQGYYTIDMTNSLVIEFSRCGLKNNKLREGRIWAEFKIVVGNSFQGKEEEFLKWYQKIARWIKRNYKRMENGWYIGPKTEEWVQNGGTLIYAYQPFE